MSKKKTFEAQDLRVTLQRQVIRIYIEVACSLMKHASGVI